MSERLVLQGLERAQTWRALSRALSPPLDRSSLLEDLVAARSRAHGALAAALDAARGALEADAGGEMAAAYEGIFSGRGGVPARESAYADGRLVAPTELADVRGFLRAFGLEERGALADHVATECEIASALALKEAYAHGQGWTRRARIAGEAYASFLDDHLLRWAPRFAAGVRRAEAPAFYLAASEALTGFLLQEAGRLGLGVPELRDPAPAPEPPEEPPCSGCPGAAGTGPEPSPKSRIL